MWTSVATGTVIAGVRQVILQSRSAGSYALILNDGVGTAWRPWVVVLDTAVVSAGGNLLGIEEFAFRCGGRGLRFDVQAAGPLVVRRDLQAYYFVNSGLNGRAWTLYRWIV